MKLFFAVTLYDGKMYGKCADAIMKNAIKLMQAGHKVAVYYDNDLYIDRSRNMCVNLFMDSDCSDMVFIDADMWFDSDAISKLVKHDKEIVAGSYPLKSDDVHYTTVLDFSHENNCKEEETGLVYAKSVATGLMRINRRAFVKMKEHYHIQADERGIVPFFETGMIFDDGNWWGEDTAFCKKWHDMGGEIFVEPNINFLHIGRKEFAGNFHEYLMGRSVEQAHLDGVETGIPGWMTDDELGVLGYLASKSDSIVEVGCWKGRSTKRFLESCKGPVYAVDHWSGTVTDVSSLVAYDLDVYDDFIKNVGGYKNLTILKGDSVKIAKTFDKNVSMVFIDAGHEYEDCKTDIEAWLPKCSRIIAGHDYSNEWPGVKKAVDEKFDKINKIGSIWWVEL